MYALPHVQVILNILQRLTRPLHWGVCSNTPQVGVAEKWVSTLSQCDRDYMDAEKFQELAVCKSRWFIAM